MSRYQNAEGALLLVQAAFLVPLLSLQHAKALLDNMAGGITLELFAIKLWLLFEEGFQYLIESTEVLRDIYKDCSEYYGKDATGKDYQARLRALGSDRGDSLIRGALVQLATASAGLRAVLDLSISAYENGWISLIVLQRTMRTTLTDPKPLVQSYHRAFTVWMNDRLFDAAKVNSSERDYLDITSSASAEEKDEKANGGNGKKRSRTEEEEDEDEEDYGEELYVIIRGLRTDMFMFR
tara:strand:- start:105 stop:818 length:714 start_codon:yes stop_codon:yes gene_type:complete